MSTLRTSNLIHGSSAVTNIVLDTIGRAIFGPDGPNGRAALYVNPQNNRVGINTESPTATLTVDGAISATGDVTVGGTINLTGALSVDTLNAGAGTEAAPSVSVGTTDNGLYSPGTDQVAISTNGIERLHVDDAGNVGIGVSSLSSSSRLTLLESFGNGQTLEIKGANTGGVGSQPGITFTSVLGDNIGGIYADTNADAVFLQSGATPRMKIDSAGNIKLGTTSATFANAKTLSAYLGIADNYKPGFLLKTPDLYSGEWSVYLDSQASVTNFAIADDSAERMRIDSSGRLLVGLSSSSQIASQILQGSSFGASDPGILYLARGTATPDISQTIGSLRFSDNTHTPSAVISAARDGGTWSATSKPTYLSFQTTANGATSGSERMQIDSTGTIILPDGSPGIQFGSVSGSASSTTLDDYEEGSWNVSIQTEGGSSYTLTSSVYARYVRVGTLVYVAFSVQFSAEGSGPITIITLPFARKSGESSILNGYVTDGNNRTAIQYVNYTSASLLVRLDDGTQPVQYWSTKSNWAPTNAFVGTGVYQAA